MTKYLVYKLVYWDGFALPVRIEANWLTWDANGEIWAHVVEPRNNIMDSLIGMNGWDSSGEVYQVSPSAYHSGVRIPAPQRAPWYEQVYWIGD